MTRHPTLDSIERRTDRPQDRPRHRLTPEQARVEAERVNPPLGTFTDCWCGLPRDHDWPGKDAGHPHPRREAP